MPDWTWDPAKDRVNRGKHGFGFALAAKVFDDPLALSRLDEASGHEERWQTVGLIEAAIIFVVHTAPEGGVPGRIISARKATRLERKAYEEGDF
jgi:uncharacterized protein